MIIDSKGLQNGFKSSSCYGSGGCEESSFLGLLQSQLIENMMAKYQLLQFNLIKEGKFRGEGVNVEASSRFWRREYIISSANTRVVQFSILLSFKFIITDIIHFRFENYISKMKLNKDSYVQCENCSKNDKLNYKKIY